MMITLRVEDIGGSTSQRCLSRTFFRSSFCARPTTDSTTCPPLKMRMVGMPRIWNLKEILGFSSTLSLPTVTLPAYSVARASTVGPSRLHGPHHSAQKSTSTGGADFSTLSSKFPSVKVCTFSAAIVVSLDPQSLRYPGPYARVPVTIRSYILTYSRAERSHEKSCCIPARWICRHLEGSANRVRARPSASSSAAG